MDRQLLRGTFSGELPPSRSRLIRLYVSSSHTDMVAERKYLANKVFPQIRESCRSMGLDFMPVDLRHDAGSQLELNCESMEICLDQISKCKNTSHSSHFLGLIGETYDNGVLPPAIEKDEFETLFGCLQHLDQDAELYPGSTLANGLSTLKLWYLEDTNSEPIMYVLQPFTRGLLPTGEAGDRPSNDAAWMREWGLLQKTIRITLKLAATAAFEAGEIDHSTKVNYFKSTIEMECEGSFLPSGNTNSEDDESAQNTENAHSQHKRASEQVFCAMKSPRQRSASASRRGFGNRSTSERYALVDTNPTWGNCSPEVLLAGLKSRITSSLYLDSVYKYRSSLDAESFQNQLSRMQDNCPLVDLGFFIKNQVSRKAYREENTASSSRPMSAKSRKSRPAPPSSVMPLSNGWGSSRTSILKSSQANMTASAMLSAEVTHHTGVMQRLAVEYTNESAAMLELWSRLGSECESNSRSPVVIHGKSGSGKSTLVARFVRDEISSDDRSCSPDENCNGLGSAMTRIYRFIGTSPHSETGLALLSSVIRQMWKTGISRCPPVGEQTRLLASFTSASAYFKTLLSAVKDPLLILLDGIERLQPSRDIHLLTWLPRMTPPNVRLILTVGDYPVRAHSFSSSSSLSFLAKAQKHFSRSRTDSHDLLSPFIEMPLLSQTNAEHTLSATLSSAARRLTETQTEVLLCAFSNSGEGSPLSLKVMMRTASKWPSFHQPSEDELLEQPSLSESSRRHTGENSSSSEPGHLRKKRKRNGLKQVHCPSQEVILAFFAQLEHRHGPALVSRCFVYLTLARHGLTESELHDILSCDNAVIQEACAVHGGNPSQLSHGIRAPMLKFQHLLHDVRPFLMEASICFGLLTFRWANTAFSNACLHRYCSTQEALSDGYRAIAEYFLGTWHDHPKHMAIDSRASKDQGGRGYALAPRHSPSQPLRFACGLWNYRKLQELPYALAGTGDLTSLAREVFSNIEFLHAKVATATSTVELVEDFSSIQSMVLGGGETRISESDEYHSIGLELIRSALQCCDSREGQLAEELLARLLTPRRDILPSGLQQLVESIMQYIATERGPVYLPQNGYLREITTPAKLLDFSTSSSSGGAPSCILYAAHRGQLLVVNEGRPTARATGGKGRYRYFIQVYDVGVMVCVRDAELQQSFFVGECGAMSYQLLKEDTFLLVVEPMFETSASTVNGPSTSGQSIRKGKNLSGSTSSGQSVNQSHPDNLLLVYRGFDVDSFELIFYYESPRASPCILSPSASCLLSYDRVKRNTKVSRLEHEGARPVAQLGHLRTTGLITQNDQFAIFSILDDSLASVQRNNGIRPPDIYQDGMFDGDFSLPSGFSGNDANFYNGSRGVCPSETSYLIASLTDISDEPKGCRVSLPQEAEDVRLILTARHLVAIYQYDILSSFPMSDPMRPAHDIMHNGMGRIDLVDEHSTNGDLLLGASSSSLYCQRNGNHSRDDDEDTIMAAVDSVSVTRHGNGGGDHHPGLSSPDMVAMLRIVDVERAWTHGAEDVEQYIEVKLEGGDRPHMTVADPCGETLLVTSPESSWLYDLVTGTVRHRLPGYITSELAIRGPFVFSHDQSQLSVWDLRQGAVVGQWQEGPEAVKRPRLCLVPSEADSSVAVLYQSFDGVYCDMAKIFTAPLSSLKNSESGSATGGSGKVGSGKVVWRKNVRCTCSATSTLLFVSESNHVYEVNLLTRGRRQLPVQASWPISLIRVSPDGSTIVLGGDNFAIIRASTSKVSFFRKGKPGEIASLAQAYPTNRTVLALFCSHNPGATKWVLYDRKGQRLATHYFSPFPLPGTSLYNPSTFGYGGSLVAFPHYNRVSASGSGHGGRRASVASTPGAQRAEPGGVTEQKQLHVVSAIDGRMFQLSCLPKRCGEIVASAVDAAGKRVTVLSRIVSSSTSRGGSASGSYVAGFSRHHARNGSGVDNDGDALEVDSGLELMATSASDITERGGETVKCELTIYCVTTKELLVFFTLTLPQHEISTIISSLYVVTMMGSFGHPGANGGNAYYSGRELQHHRPTSVAARSHLSNGSRGRSSGSSIEAAPKVSLVCLQDDVIVFRPGEYQFYNISGGTVSDRPACRLSITSKVISQSESHVLVLCGSCGSGANKRPSLKLLNLRTGQEVYSFIIPVPHVSFLIATDDLSVAAFGVKGDTLAVVHANESMQAALKCQNRESSRGTASAPARPPLTLRRQGPAVPTERFNCQIL